jgi:glycerophosphoryl diester phosphodiesterase
MGQNEKVIVYTDERVIAHGSGQVLGYAITNSLEALNYSYEKGCRLFELDILQTSDNKFVAAHDWMYCKIICNDTCNTITNAYDYYYWIRYKHNCNDTCNIDATALSEEQFLSMKIHNKFTPMNMEGINKWFAEHKDAILVTDKINMPAGFVGKNGFLYKDRLIMELFSWEAIEEAIKNDITPMLTEKLVFDTENVEKKLSELNIKYIAISRRLVEDNKPFLKRLKDNGIKTYVFHINLDEGIDEKYVLTNEMDYIYGMYADNMELVSSLLNKSN